MSVKNHVRHGNRERTIAVRLPATKKAAQGGLDFSGSRSLVRGTIGLLKDRMWVLVDNWI